MATASNACAFCGIVAGATPAVWVFSDADSLAFLDNRPLVHGHVLLMPRAHHETLADLPPDAVGPLFHNAQLITRAIETGLEADGVFVAINNRVSQSVPHLHVHLVPRREKDGMKGFFWPRQRYANEQQMQEVAERLREAITRERDASR